MTIHDPVPAAPDGTWYDAEARKNARIALVIAAVAGLLALLALILAACALSNDYAPKDCDPTTDYVCKPDTVTGTSTVQVPTTTLSPTSVPVPTSTPSEIVTTTVVP